MSTVRCALLPLPRIVYSTSV